MPDFGVSVQYSYPNVASPGVPNPVGSPPVEIPGAELQYGNITGNLVVTHVNSVPLPSFTLNPVVTLYFWYDGISAIPVAQPSFQNFPMTISGSTSTYPRALLFTAPGYYRIACGLVYPDGREFNSSPTKIVASIVPSA